jgi:GH43 family beta-xylosidase
MSDRRSVWAGALVMVTAMAGLAVPSAASASSAVQLTNPLVQQRADPHIVRHTDGFYYFTASVPEYDRIILRRATTLQGLATAPETVIWRRHDSGEMSWHIWAPEIHRINGAWYIYFAAGRAEDIWRIRMYVLENTSPNPLTGSWVERGRIATPLDTFSLDATTFVHNGNRYLAWAQNDPAVGSGTSLYLAQLANPWTIAGSPVRISTPTHSWETIGHRVNEGPAVIQRNGRVFMTYSASATDANYAVGLLTAAATSNLLNPSSWSKSPQPVLRSNDATSQYGPGHNSFTVSEDGQSDILVYHARPYRDIVGDPLYDPNRHTRLQKLYWNADGTPNLGIPVADGPTPYRFASHNYPDRCIRHDSFRARIDPNVTTLADSQFRIVPGLAGSGTVSLESANYPGYFLRHRNFELWLERNDGSTTFRNAASYHQRAGLADAAGVSFESFDNPGRFIRHYAFLLYAQPVASELDRADATFHLE